MATDHAGSAAVKECVCWELRIALFWVAFHADGVANGDVVQVGDKTVSLMFLHRLLKHIVQLKTGVNVVPRH